VHLVGVPPGPRGADIRENDIELAAHFLLLHTVAGFPHLQLGLGLRSGGSAPPAPPPHLATRLPHLAVCVDLRESLIVLPLLHQQLQLTLLLGLELHPLPHTLRQVGLRHDLGAIERMRERDLRASGGFVRERIGVNGWSRGTG